MSSSEGFGNGPYDHLLGQGAAGFTPENMNMHGFHQESENNLSKKKRNKNRSSGANGGLQLVAGSKTLDKSSGFLPKNGRKSNGQAHNNNTNDRRPSQSEFELLCDKEDLDNRATTEFNGNFNGFHSPRGSTSAWNGKQDNTKAIPDPSAIVERLMHLRDCIKQVSSILTSLEKTDEPVAGKQMGNLNQMLQMLRKEEQENMELLQQVLACREESERASAQSAAAPCRDLPPLQVTTTASRRRNVQPVQQEVNDEENEEPQSELLLRMIDSQKKFATIREQQASLLRLQKQAEEKLAAARAFHDHFVQASLVASESGMARSVSSQLSSSSSGGRSAGSSGSGVHEGRVPDPLLMTHEQDVGCDDDGGVLVLSPNADDLDDDLLAGLRPPVVPPRKDESRGTPSFDLEDIQTRISALREFQLDRLAQCEQLEDGVETVVSRLSRSDMISREQAQRATQKQRQQLEGKLQQLQQKKHQMDTLLAELSTLQNGSAQSGSDDQLDIPSVSPASFPSPVNSASHDAKVVSDIGEAQRKLKQLEEMKNTLRTLQRLTENIEQVDNSLNKEEVVPPPPPMRGRSQSHSDSGRSVTTLKPDNLRRDCPAAVSAQFPARRHYEAEGRANEDADAVQNVTALATPNLAVLAPITTSSNDSNGNGSSRSDSAAGDSRSMDQKVKKLADAETKLQHLKLLLTAMQHGCPDAGDQPYAAALLSSLQGQQELSANGSLSPLANNNAEDPGDESEDSGVSAGQAKRDQYETVAETGQRQLQLKHDLDLLLRERRRLASMQEQLSNLQLQFVPSPSATPPNASSLNNSKDRSSGEGGSMLRARAGSATLSQSFTPNEMGRQDNLHRDNIIPRNEAKTLNSQANNGPQANKPRARARGVPQESLPASRNNHRGAPVLQEASLPANHNNNNSQANNGYSDLSDQLTYNLALRDELRAQKAVLQELLSQERSKQMGFSHNQDTQSHSESSGKTDKSEAIPVQCQSMGPVPPLDHHDVSVDHWALLGSHQTEEAPPYSAIESLSGFDDQHQSGLSSPWQKNFPSSSPAQEDSLPFQQMVHTNFSRRSAPPRLPPSPLAQPPPQQPIQQQQPHNYYQQQQQQQQWDQLSRHFQKQAESTHTLCQSVLREQQAMILLAAKGGSVSSSTGSSNGGPPTELVSSYVQQLQQQQQLLFSLSHCFHLLCLQQMQVTQIHAAWAMQSQNQAPNIPRRPDLPPSPYAFQAVNDPAMSYGYASPWTTASSATKTPSTPQAMAFFQSTGPGVMPLPFGYPTTSNMGNPMSYNVISGDDNASVSSGNSLAAGRPPAPETLNNQMPPRSRTNNFLDNFRSNSRQNLLSSGKCNDPSQHLQKVKPVAADSPTCGNPSVQDAAGSLRTGFVFSSLATEQQPFQQQQPSPNRANLPPEMLAGGHFGGHLGGVRPRTKRPNLSQDKSNSLIHGPTNVVTSLPSGNQSPQLPANRNAATVFSPTPMSCLFGKAAHEISLSSSSREQQAAPSASKPYQSAANGARATQGDSLQERIYSEVDSLLSQWEEQPGVLGELLQQIRAFEGPSQELSAPAPAAAGVHAGAPSQQRCNLLDLGIPPEEKLEESSSSNAKLSKHQASFGSKRAKTQSAVGLSQSSEGFSRSGQAPSTSSSQRAPPPLCINSQHKNLDFGCSQTGLRQAGTASGMESIPESYTMTVIKSEKPDIVSHLRGGTTEGASEESFSMPTTVSSSATTSSTSSSNVNHKGVIAYQPINQQNEDYRAAPDGGAAPPPSLPTHGPAASMTGGGASSAAGTTGTKYPEDCGSYHYDAEGETEAETEDDDTKDLAEADQSAGQSGLAHGLLRDGAVGMAQQELSLRSCSSSMSVAGGGGGMAEGGEELCTLSTDIISSSSGGGGSSTNPCCSCPLAAHDSCSQQSNCLSSSAQASAPDMDVDELALDDVPIKLETLSADELRRQISDEQASNCLLGEILSDVHGTQLTPENDSGLPHPGAF